MQITTVMSDNKVVARGFGKQATVKVNSEMTIAENHAKAAGELLSRNGATSAMFHPSNMLSAEGTFEKAVWKFKKII